MHAPRVSMLALMALATVAFPGSASPVPERSRPAAKVRVSPQDKKKITVPAGTRILIRTIDPIDTEKQKTGFRFTGSLETNLQAEDEVVAPRGSMVYGRLAEASSSGRMSGSSQLTLELTDALFRRRGFQAKRLGFRVGLLDLGLQLVGVVAAIPPLRPQNRREHGEQESRDDQ